MEVTIKLIREAVKVAIDEIAANDAEFASGQDNAEADTIIDSKIEEAIDYVHRLANIGLMQGDVFLTVPTGQPNAGVASVTIATDRIARFVKAEAVGWKYPVTIAYEATDDEYAIATDPYVGGSVNHPMVTMSQSAGSIVFTIYKTSSTASGSGTITYIPLAERIESEADNAQPEDDSYYIDANMYQAVIYRIAGLVEMTYGEERAKVLLEMANTLIGVAN